jgi:hypothetical protein
MMAARPGQPATGPSMISERFFTVPAYNRLGTCL